MVERRVLAVMVGLALAFACDSKRTAEDDEDGAGDGGEAPTAASGGKGSGGKGGGGGKGGSAGSAARGGDGMGESGAPASGGAGGASGGNGGEAGDGAMGGTGGASGDGGTGGALGGTGGAGGTGGTAGVTAGAAGSAGSGGSGGNAGNAGKGGAAGASGAAGAGSCGNLIDDMEAGTGYVCQGNGRTGSWFSYVSTYGTFSPPGYPVPTTLLASPRGNSTRAMRAYGTNDDYAGFGCWLVTTPATYDASAHAGIRFYATGSPATLRVIIQTSGTESTTYGGACTLPTLECAGNETQVTLTSGWVLYQITFSEFIGGTVPFDPGDIWSIEFQPGSVGPYDFTIDDLSFY